MKKSAQTTKPPEFLSDEEYAKLSIWARQKYRGITGQEIREFAEECLDWHVANGRERVDWLATCRNWIRGGMRFRRERQRVQQQEKPKIRMPPSAFAPVESLLDRIGKRI